MSDIRMPRLLAAAKEFNIGQDELIRFLISLGFHKDDLKSTSKLTPGMYQALFKKYKNSSANSNFNKTNLTDISWARVKLQPSPSAQNKKSQQTGNNFARIGRVKFFDNAVNHFGIAISLTDSTESHISQLDLIEGPINTGDIISYEQIPNGFKKFKAIKVTSKIPVFIFNKNNSSNSFAYSMVEQNLGYEFPLSGKHNIGFVTLDSCRQSLSTVLGFRKVKK